MTKYKIVRHFKRSWRRYTIEQGLTLTEAQAHCKSVNASSKTAVRYDARRRTKLRGAWFDSYQEE